LYAERQAEERDEEMGQAVADLERACLSQPAARREGLVARRCGESWREWGTRSSGTSLNAARTESVACFPSPIQSDGRCGVWLCGAAGL
jgi:hypothetical protein